MGRINLLWRCLISINVPSSEDGFFTLAKKLKACDTIEKLEAWWDLFEGLRQIRYNRRPIGEKELFLIAKARYKELRDQH